MESHLLQMRGLKLQLFSNLKHLSKSHLLQMRGLKLMVVSLYFAMKSRIFYRCVD